MHNQIEEPTEKISEKAILVWRTMNSFILAGAFIILIVLLIAHTYFSWYDWIAYVLWGLISLSLLDIIWSIYLEPYLLQKYWRYQVDENFVQLKHGRWKLVHIVIPMTKIQYVGLKQGPLLRKYNLHTLSIGTMASTHEIPAIPEDTARAIRDQIADLANINDEEGVE